MNNSVSPTTSNADIAAGRNNKFSNMDDDDADMNADGAVVGGEGGEESSTAVEASEFGSEVLEAGDVGGGGGAAPERSHGPSSMNNDDSERQHQGDGHATASNNLSEIIEEGVVDATQQEQVNATREEEVLDDSIYNNNNNNNTDTSIASNDNIILSPSTVQERAWETASSDADASYARYRRAAARAAAGAGNANVGKGVAWEAASSSDVSIQDGYAASDEKNKRPEVKGRGHHNEIQQQHSEQQHEQAGAREFISQHQQPQPKFKFCYEPLEYERGYYNALFHHASNKGEGHNPVNNSNNTNIILPPQKAAALFLTSGIPSDRLRMIWNMSVLLAKKSSKNNMKPPPAMTMGQFCTAVRLIQLFQNRVTAKDELLRVETGVMMAPAYFAGVSGVIVPLPWREMNMTSSNMNGGSSNLGHSNHSMPTNNNGGKGKVRRRRASASRMESLHGSFKSTHTNRSIRSGENRRPGNGKRNAHRSSLRSSLRSSKNSSGSGGREGSTSMMVAYDADNAYAMSHSEFLTYQDTFSRHCVTEVNGSSHSNDLPEQHVYVDEAVGLFTKSGLDRPTLGKLWDVVVSDPDSGKLDEEEFVLMTHLIVCVTRRGLDVPGELPVVLRNWRRNRLFDDRLDGQQKGDESGMIPVKMTPVDFDNHQRHSHTHPRRGSGSVHNRSFTSTGSSSAHKRSFTSNSGSANAAVDAATEERIRFMEKEISSLRQLVESLRTEVQDLKGTVQQQRGEGIRVNANHVDENDNINVSTGGGGRGTVFNHVDENDDINVSARSGGPHYDSASIDDVPNVDVEMYWGEKKDESTTDVSKRTHNSMGIEKPSRQPQQQQQRYSRFEPTRNQYAPKPSPTMQHQPHQPQSIMKQPTVGQRNQSIPKRPVERSSMMSQNIPHIHPGVGRQQQSQSRKTWGGGGSRQLSAAMHRSMPQSQMGHVMPVPTKNSVPMSKSVIGNGSNNNNPGFSKPMANNDGHRNERVSKSMMINGAGPDPSVAAAHNRSGGVSKSMINNGSATQSLASQMKQVQREEKFDTLIQKTMERLGSNSDAGSNASSQNSARQYYNNADYASSFKASSIFKPAKITRKNVQSGNKQRGGNRGSLTKTDLVQSASHIRRRLSGETEIYQKVMTPSTAAVDLPPLL